MEQCDNELLLRQLERRNDELASMVEIGKALTKSLDLREVLQAIMNQVSRLLKPSAWSLLLVDQAQGDLTFEIAVSPVSCQLLNMRLKVGEGIAGWVAQHGQPLLIPDVAKDERFAAHIAGKLDYATRSVVCVPLNIRDTTIGVIELINSYEQLMFNDSDLALLSTIADFAAIAIENARNYVRVNELVITDDLTGLFNSRHFGQLLDYETGRALRYNSCASLVFLDLDHLKLINDSHGHLVGSRMLSEFGRLIKANIRSSDLAARYGGDEFVVILPQAPKQAAVALAHKLLHIMRESEFFADDGQRIHLTASFGVATFPDDAKDRLGLVKAADEAMYRAKKAGRNTVMEF